jgi:hypothetical protein
MLKVLVGLGGLITTTTTIDITHRNVLIIIVLLLLVGTSTIVKVTSLGIDRHHPAPTARKVEPGIVPVVKFGGADEG